MYLSTYYIPTVFIKAMLKHTGAPIRRWRRKRDGSILLVTKKGMKITVYTTDHMVRVLEAESKLHIK